MSKVEFSELISDNVVVQKRFAKTLFEEKIIDKELNFISIHDLNESSQITLNREEAVDLLDSIQKALDEEVKDDIPKWFDFIIDGFKDELYTAKKINELTYFIHWKREYFGGVGSAKHTVTDVREMLETGKWKIGEEKK